MTDSLPFLLHPPAWPRGSGYAHGIAAEGRQIFVAGQIGCDPVTRRMAGESIAAQTRQALANIVAVLAEAGAGPQHLVRLTWFITDRDLYLRERKAIGAAYREVIGRHSPPMSILIVAGLLEKGADVEIEATAVVPVGDRTTNSAGAERRSP
jgi:enamine deaminase RidA (YjgF/YER057c/UK114 family)